MVGKTINTLEPIKAPNVQSSVYQCNLHCHIIAGKGKKNVFDEAGNNFNVVTL